jgi:hypothetical protein
MKNRTLIALAALAALVGNAQAQDNKSFSLGVSAGLFFPTDSEIRDIFGESIFRWGITPFADRNVGRWKVFTDIGLVHTENDDDRFLLIPAVVGIETRWGDRETDQAVPYARLGAGITYMDYSIERPSTMVRHRARKFGTTALGEVGVILHDRLRVSASYNWFSKTDGFDFSGLNLSATYTVARF